MKLFVFYRPNGESSRQVEEFVRNLQAQHGLTERQIKLYDYNSRDGFSTASLYDVMRQPAFLVVNDDGSYVKHWEGAELPQSSEVAGYMLGQS